MNIITNMSRLLDPFDLIIVYPSIAVTLLRWINEMVHANVRNNEVTLCVGST